MSRKDYIAVANTIRAQVAADRAAESEAMAVGRALAMVAAGLAEQFKADNPRFDRVRFMSACGV